MSKDMERKQLVLEGMALYTLTKNTTMLLLANELNTVLGELADLQKWQNAIQVLQQRVKDPSKLIMMADEMTMIRDDGLLGALNNTAYNGQQSGEYMWVLMPVPKVVE